MPDTVPVDSLVKLHPQPHEAATSALPIYMWLGSLWLRELE